LYGVKSRGWYRFLLHAACGATLLTLTTCMGHLQDSIDLVFASNAPANAMRLPNTPLLQAALTWLRLWVP
jgi:hypothetical protein